MQDLMEQLGASDDLDMDQRQLLLDQVCVEIVKKAKGLFNALLVMKTKEKSVRDVGVDNAAEAGAEDGSLALHVDQGADLNADMSSEEEDVAGRERGNSIHWLRYYLVFIYHYLFYSNGGCIQPSCCNCTPSVSCYINRSPCSSSC
jgi:hypothetical protein